MSGHEHEPRIGALDELGRRLDVAVRRAPRRRWWRRPVLLAAVGGAVVAGPAVAVVTDGFDFGAGSPRAGQPGGPPLPVTGLPRARTLDVARLAMSPPGRRELRRRLSTVGIDVVVRWRPVAEPAVGRVFGVQFPRRARFQDHRLVLERGVGGAVRIVVGRAARPGEATSTAGLTLYEVLPQVRRAVARDDPAGTGRRLAALGFSVRWRLLVDNPENARDPSAPATGWKDVPSPPDGTVVVSVLNTRGQHRATRATRALMVEIAPAGSRVARGHGG